MFDIGSSELLLIVIVAVVVIGPKELPRALYKLGQIVGKGRAMTRHFRTGFDAMVREAELEEMQKQWAKENERIMALHPPGPEGLTPLPAPEAGVAATPDLPVAQGVAETLPAVPETAAPAKRTRKPRAAPDASA